MIVTPSSLVKNWAKEIKKWVSNERLTPLVVSSSTKQSAASIIDDFKRSYHKVLIVSYDLCRINEKEMKNVPCDLLICDEAHRFVFFFLFAFCFVFPFEFKTQSMTSLPSD